MTFIIHDENEFVYAFIINILEKSFLLQQVNTIF